MRKRTMKIHSKHLKWPESIPDDYTSNMYYPPAPDAAGYDELIGYALSIDGYQYANDRWKLSEIGPMEDKMMSFKQAGTWKGSFEDLRCCLFLMQRKIKWIESGSRAVKERADFEAIYKRLCTLYKQICVSLNTSAASNSLVSQSAPCTVNLSFNVLLSMAGFCLSDVRLLRHKDSRADKGRTPYELWRDDPDSFCTYQARQNPNRRKTLSAPFWASFVVTPQNETLFAGMYAVQFAGPLTVDSPMPHTDGIDSAGSCDTYTLKLDARLSDFIGRLIIDWGDGERAWVQKPEQQVKRVLELRKEFKEPEFPGFNHFIHSLSKLDAIPLSWISILKASRGVYLLTCPKTKEHYVGSASGCDGFWGRWQEYAKTGHGGNTALKGKGPSDYQISILEVAGSTATTDDIVNLENIWKQKLLSREIGLNLN